MTAALCNRRFRYIECSKTLFEMSLTMQCPDESKRLRLSHNLGHGGILTDLAGLAVLTAASFACLPGASRGDLQSSLDLQRRCIDQMAAEYGYEAADVDDAIVNFRRAGVTGAILSSLDALDLSGASASAAKEETRMLLARLSA